MTKILIIGRKFNGKTTFARMMKEALKDAETYSTSEYLVYRLALISGIQPKDVLADKERFRPELIRLGNTMCDVDPGCLVSICLWASRSQMVFIDGIRRICEYERVKDWFDRIYWIERPGLDEGLDNLELNSTHATHHIVNDGSMEDLRKKAKMEALNLEVGV